MATATKTKKEPEQVLTFEQINEKKLREKIEAYRGFVKRAAEGEMLPEEALEAVADILAFLYLPDYCWARDVEAIRKHKHDADAVAEMTSKQPKLEAEAKELVVKIRQLEEDLKQARTRLNYCSVITPASLVERMRRMRELETVHPHLLADLDLAVQVRAEARAKMQAKQVPAKPAGRVLEGWST